MGSIKLPHASGNSVSIAAPQSNPAADRTIYLNDNYAGDGSFVTADSSGLVGIGTASPTNAYGIDKSLHIHSTLSSGNRGAGIHLTTNASGSATGDGLRISLVDSDATIDNRENGIITIRTNDATRVRIDSDGLKFGTDGAAANALNDYEEGDVTLKISNADGSTKRSTYNGVKYTKIGRMVHLYGRMDCNEFANYFGSAVLYIDGLPFSTGSEGDSADLIVPTWGDPGLNLWDNGYPSISMENNSTRPGFFVHRTNSSTYTHVTGSNLGAGTMQFNFDLTYFTD